MVSDPMDEDSHFGGCYGTGEDEKAGGDEAEREGEDGEGKM